MFNFLKKEENNSDNIELDIAALLIHAAKIDEKYTLSEIEIIKKTLIELGSNKDELENILISAEKIESDSNQILSFTKKIKNLDQNIKLKILESLLIKDSPSFIRLLIFLHCSKFLKKKKFSLSDIFSCSAEVLIIQSS